MRRHHLSWYGSLPDIAPVDGAGAMRFRDLPIAARRAADAAFKRSATQLRTTVDWSTLEVIAVDERDGCSYFLVHALTAK